MKTTHYFTTLLLLITLNSFAQLDKKTWLVGGNLSFDSFKKEYTNYFGSYENPTINTAIVKYNIFNINTKVGYFVIDKLSIGISPSFSYSNEKDVQSAYVSNSSTLSIGPFVRYYFLDKNKPYNLFTDVTYQTGYKKEPAGNNYGTLKSPITKFSAMAGIEMFFNSSTGIEFLAGYNYLKQSGDRAANGASIIQFEDKGFKVAIGFQLHLEKEK